MPDPIVVSIPAGPLVTNVAVAAPLVTNIPGTPTLVAAVQQVGAGTSGNGPPA
jgi:hypothetical protein